MRIYVVIAPDDDGDHVVGVADRKDMADYIADLYGSTSKIEVHDTDYFTGNEVAVFDIEMDLEGNVLSWIVGEHLKERTGSLPEVTRHRDFYRVRNIEARSEYEAFKLASIEIECTETEE